MGGLNGMDTTSETRGGADVLIGAVKDLPEATEAFAQDAWDHPGKFLKSSGKTLGESAVIGVAMGVFVPSRGLAAGLAALTFTAPIVVGGIRRLGQAYRDGNESGADLNALSKSLAGDFVHGSWEFTLGSAGGAIGAGLGHRIATSETLFGGLSQGSQRLVLSGENASMIGLAKLPEVLKVSTVQGIASPEPVEAAAAKDSSATDATAKASDATAVKAAKPWFLGKDWTITNRFAQAAAGPREYTIRMGTLHGHSNYSDGMGTPSEIFAKAKADGMDFYAITDHNHLAARQGVKPSDPRAADQANVPILASMPSEYTSTMADAKAATEDGKFVAIVGVEMGTIGHVGGGGHSGPHDSGAEGSADDGASLKLLPSTAEGEVFHTAEHSSILGEGHTHALPDSFAHMDVPADLPAPTVIRRVFEPDGQVKEHQHTLPKEQAAQAYREQMFLKAQKAASLELHALAPAFKPQLSLQQQAIAEAAERDAGHYSGINHVNVFEYPQLIVADRAGDTGERAAGAIHYNDGDFNSLIKQIGNSPDTTGNLPVWQLNHPRYMADNSPNLPANLRGRDYGVKSFPNEAAWLAAMEPRVHQVEIITGEALNPEPITVMKPQDLGPVNMAGYIDKGLHVSPTYGRDDHYALPGGRPAGTGILADTLDKPSLLAGLRNRQTMATTSTELLQGYMTANDTFAMGSILDQNAVNDLNIKMHVKGQIDPKAKYVVSLWSDPSIGDGKLATMIQSKSLTGQDLLNSQSQVAFDQVHHTIGNKSAWYVEVQRTDPTTSNNDYMWTAPVWVEPLAGQSHSLLTRALVGAGSSYILGNSQ